MHEYLPLKHKETPTPTWAVVATVDEPAVLVAAFACHHLAIGASEVHLYLDRPHPDLAPLIAHLDGCFVTLCDDAYWAASTQGTRPPHHLRRQKLNANAAFHKTQCAWILHCDADEFVGDATSITTELEQLQSTDDPEMAHYAGLKLYNQERVWCSDLSPSKSGNIWGQTHLFSGGFRFPTELYDDVLREHFRPFGLYLNRGISGHAGGKTLSRVGAPLDLGIHFATDLGSHVPAPRYGSKATLYHFDGLTPLHYILKMLKRGYETPNGPRKRRGIRRLDQARFIRKHAENSAKMKRFVQTIKALNTSQIQAYSTVMAYDDTPFEVQGCQELDLCAATFNTKLRTENAALFEKAGLAYWGS